MNAAAREAIPLGLYVHLPWCLRKCPYCDFNSHAWRDGPLPEADYVDALLADLEHDLPLVWGRRVSSVFLGGGTPSLFSGEAIHRLLQGLRARLSLDPWCEITLEANPGAVEQGRFRDYRQAGVNRLSLGVQSFDDRALAALGRVHDAAAARRAVDTARAAGFDNLNLDLMFGLPGQDLAASQRDLRQAIALQPEHLSFYQLTIEPHTRFHARPPVLPDDGTRWAMQQAGHALLAEHGYRQYEVSAFARAGRACRHNRNYWEFGDYLGIGAGAHGKLTDPARGTVQRRHKLRQPRAYLAAAADPGPLAAADPIEPSALPFEFMLNALRLRDGVPRSLFTARTGLPWSAVAGTVATLVDEELLTVADGRLRATALGWRFLDDVVARFLPD